MYTSKLTKDHTSGIIDCSALYGAGTRVRQPLNSHDILPAAI